MCIRLLGKKDYMNSVLNSLLISLFFLWALGNPVLALQHVAKIYGLENLSLWQKLIFLMKFKDEYIAKMQLLRI